MPLYGTDAASFFIPQNDTLNGKMPRNRTAKSTKKDHLTRLEPGVYPVKNW